MEAIDLARGDKKHRASKTGAKARKKDDNKKKKLGLSKERHNPKAFSVANIVRTKRTQQRNLDRAQKKEVVPLVDRAEELPPPALVVVMGPPGCGKSTLIRSLVKIYTNQNMTDILGPVTVIAGKKKRLTFFECPHDIHSMTDLAKVADLVLLMVDGSYGFEMETFEYLNLLQLHGFPKVLGITTHLDRFKLNKTLQKTKKNLKHRFWTEIYKGAKMFDFTGVINGKYLKHEIKRLTLHMSRMKFRPLVWRNTHPFVMVDRVEDVTAAARVQEDPLCDRDVVLFGYVRGTHLKPSMRVHLIGVGDFDVSSASALPDPCPLPAGMAPAAAGKVVERASLKISKDSLLYAPLANVGRVRMDKDGTYIDLHSVHYTKAEHLDFAERGQAAGARGALPDPSTPAGLLRSMQDFDVGVNERMETAELSLFAGSRGVRSSDIRPAAGRAREGDASDPEDGSERDGSGSESSGDDGESSGGEDESDRDCESEEESDRDCESEDELDGGYYDSGDDVGRGSGGIPLEPLDTFGSEWKVGMAGKAALNYAQRSTAHGASGLTQQVYGIDWALGETAAPAPAPAPASAKASRPGLLWDEDEDAGAVVAAAPVVDVPDTSRVKHAFTVSPISIEETIQELLVGLKNKFVTGDWSKANKIAAGNGVDSDGEEFGEFEDLQTGEVYGRQRGGSGASDSDSDAESDDNDKIDEQLRAINAEKKAKSMLSRLNKDEENEGAEKETGGEDEQKELDRRIEEEQRRRAEQADRNKTEFGEEGEQARLRHEGLRQGLYVRLVLKGVPAEFCAGFRPDIPVIVGGLQPHESAMGIVHARVKRHRWHKRILKCNDPLIFSIGWRRFQSIPVYAMEDDSERKRYLKYTPEHMHCMCSFYGPLVPPNTGILAYQKTDRSTAGFRIALTGTALEMSASVSIVKKLKLVGTPTKTFKNTAFIKGMFNTALEVAKFEGSKLKTVSGIRGQIKKAMKGDAESGGIFRATFEDKIAMSDIVFCRVWVPVPIKEFYNPVTSLLPPSTEQAMVAWQGMRPISQIRKDENIGLQVNKDSVYKPIVRVPKTFSKLNLPKKLQEALPFASKPKQSKAKNPDTYMARRAVVMDKEDRQRRAAVQMLSTIRADKKSKRHEATLARSEKKQKLKQREADKFADVHREEKKRKYAEDAKAVLRQQKKQKH